MEEDHECGVTACRNINKQFLALPVAIHSHIYIHVFSALQIASLCMSCMWVFCYDIMLSTQDLCRTWWRVSGAVMPLVIITAQYRGWSRVGVCRIGARICSIAGNQPHNNVIVSTEHSPEQGTRGRKQCINIAWTFESTKHQGGKLWWRCLHSPSCWFLIPTLSCFLQLTNLLARTICFIFQLFCTSYHFLHGGSTSLWIWHLA